ncbi:MAG: dephospho-CoA kinase [Proteobacteria bacterium]|nr:dephospho-CoA kinase [Pseudomonadota bacterium]
MARFVVAVTGGIASGKTAVCRAFERLGVTVADADVLARELVAPGQPALQEIVARFGDGILTAQGELDRIGLRRIVFADAASRIDLETILHPRIRKALRDACAVASSPYAIAAIPLLAEGGGRAAYPWLDRILVVDVPGETQMQRLLSRDGGSVEQAERMLAAQASRTQRLAIADDVVENDGTLAQLGRQIDALHMRYLQMAADKA